MAKPWLVLDMDEGLIRREPSRKAAVAWCTGRSGIKVLSRHCFRPGAYQYTFGWPGEDSGFGHFIEHEDAARDGGWECLDDEAKYPHADDPYQQRDDEG